MYTLERIYKLHQILKGQHTPIAATALMRRLECSRATLFRTLNHLQKELGAPIVNEPRRGYRYDSAPPAFELPGVWFSPEELEGLLVAEHMLESLKATGFEDMLAPIRAKLLDLLHKGTIRVRRFPVDRFRFLPTHSRHLDGAQFKSVVTAVVERRQLHFIYRARNDGKQSERTVSPQRLVYYRDHWYLDAQDMDKKALRTFALDCISGITVLKKSAADVTNKKLDAELASSYGIFSGKPRNRARLLFTPERARWVADERWHSDQSGRALDDGSYELQVPYSDHRELLGEILRHGSHVQVLRPKALRRAVVKELERAQERYGAK